MSLLAKENLVLYVEPRPYLRSIAEQLCRGEISLADFRARTVTRVSHGLHLFHPPLCAPLSGRVPLSTMTDALRAALLRRAMRRLNMCQPILWLFRPEMADVPGRYGEHLLIYHIVDEYTAYADIGARRTEDMRRRERGLIGKADLVLVTSRALLKSKGGINPNTHWVPNGVDYDRFAAAVAEPAEPPELEGLARPRIGYVGAINDKIDLGLLLDVAQAYTDASIILVGPVHSTSEGGRQGVQALRSRPNVHMVGQVPMERVPQFMASCDVGLLPYKQNAWTHHIHPLKMYEYLACGLPVVATDIPAVREEPRAIRIATDAAEFILAVGEALADDDEGSRVMRQDRASRNTWQHRVECISRLIEATLQEKHI